MAGIKQNDLEGLSNEEIYNFFKTEDLEILPEKARNFILSDNPILPDSILPTNEWYLRIIRKGRVKSILDVIILERFKAGEIK